jgi:hypothetical protein
MNTVYRSATPLASPEAIQEYLNTLPKNLLNPILGRDPLEALVPEVAAWFRENAGSNEVIHVLGYLDWLTIAVHLDDEESYNALLLQEANKLSGGKFADIGEFHSFLDTVHLSQTALPAPGSRQRADQHAVNHGSR